MSAVAVLSRPVLVLNRNWLAIQVSSVKEAIGLVCKGSAKIIEPGSFEAHDILSWGDVSRFKMRDGDAVIRSPRMVLVPPEVILLTNYEGLGEKSVVFSRRNLFKRDHYTCQYCGVQPGPAELTIDHVMPKSRGGASSWENCLLACVPCNKRKSNRTPAEAGMIPRKVPKKPSWKALAQISPGQRRESWSHFISRAYWEVELES